MPAKRIRSRYATISGGGGGTPDVNVPSFRYSEDFNADDAIGSLLVTNPEEFTLDDELEMLLVANPENVSLGEEFNFPIVTPTYAEDVTGNDLVKARFLDVDVGRSGTPDSDQMWDAWTDQAATTTNHGNEALLVKGKSTAANDERRGYIGLNFSWAGDWTSVTSGIDVVVQASNSSILLALTVNWDFRSVTTKPFTESTVTWASPPTLGTSRNTGSFSVPAGGAFSNFTISLAANGTQFLCGNYGLIVFTCASTVAPDTATIRSRDDGTAGNRPKWSLNSLQRGT